MSSMIKNKAFTVGRLLPVVMVMVGTLLMGTAQAAAPGITGPTFNLTAQPAFISQPPATLRSFSRALPWLHRGPAPQPAF